MTDLVCESDEVKRISVVLHDSVAIGSRGADDSEISAANYTSVKIFAGKEMIDVCGTKVGVCDFV